LITKKVLKKMRLLFVFISSIVFYQLSTAQPLTSVPLDIMLDTGDEQVEKKDWVNALDWYEKAYKEQKDNNLALEIAYLQYKLRDYEDAGRWYKRILDRDPNNEFMEDRYLYGKTLKAQGKYQEAAQQFRMFIDSSQTQEVIVLAKNELKGIDMINKYEENIGTVVTFAEKDINSGFTEFSPRQYQDGTLYYSSIPAKKQIEVDYGNEEHFARIYTSQKTDKGYEDPTPLGTHINRQGYHTGNLAFSRDGRRMYFTRSVLYGNDLDESKLYMSTKSDTDWSPPIEIESINGDFRVKHPTVGELFGNEVIYFSSDMEGGIGGYDIYYTTVSGDTYAAPVNLGPTVNTAQDEETPFYQDGSLYFSSEGYPGLGGFDIYTTAWDGSKWSEITNMGFNYNSSYDDKYFNMNGDGTNGYIVSNRLDKAKRSVKGKSCCDDIYEFNIRELIIDLIVEVSEDKGPLDGAKIRLIDESEATDPKERTNPEGNEFQFLLESERSYRAIVSKDGYYPDTLEFNTSGIIDDFTVNKKSKLKPIPEAPKEPEYETITINQSIRLNNIYFDLNKWDILPDAEKDLSNLLELMNKYPTMVIELSSHTDSQGVSSYNQKLSQQRAESTKRWLLNKGVADERIKPIGYGENKILNRCVNGVRCNDDEHRFNRRSEFKIIGGPESIEIKKEVLKGAQKVK